MKITEKENIMTPNEFAETIIHLPVEQQNAFFEALREHLSEEDWLATVKFISVFGMYHSQAKYNAMKQAVKETIVEELFGHPYKEPEHKCFDPCNPVYMTSINDMPIFY